MILQSLRVLAIFTTAVGAASTFLVELAFSATTSFSLSTTTPFAILAALAARALDLALGTAILPSRTYLGRA